MSESPPHSPRQPQNRKMIILLGAPANNTLLAALPNEKGLLTFHLPAFCRLFGPALSPKEHPMPDLNSFSGSIPSWRRLSLKRKHLHSGFTQFSSAKQEKSRLAVITGNRVAENTISCSVQTTTRLTTLEHLDNHGTNTLAAHGATPTAVTSSYSTTENSMLFSYDAGNEIGCFDVSIRSNYSSSSRSLHSDEEIATFLDQSFSNHYSFGEDSDVFFSPQALATTSNQSSLTSISKQPRDGMFPHFSLSDLPPLSHLIDLEDLPTASQVVQMPLTRISTIVGIISVQSPIQVLTRYSNLPHELMKLTIGDETAAGIGVSIWLDPTCESDSVNLNRNNKNSSKLSHSRVLRASAESLRPGDVALLQYFGMSVWKDTVDLNSKRGMSYIQFLYRCNDEDEHDVRFSLDTKNHEKITVVDQQVEKVKRVIDWTRKYAMIPNSRIGGQTGDTPPPDTPDTSCTPVLAVERKIRTKRHK